MTKVKRTYALLERDLLYIRSPANAIRIFMYEYSRYRYSEMPLASSQERLETCTFRLTFVSNHTISCRKAAFLFSKPQRYFLY